MFIIASKLANTYHVMFFNSKKASMSIRWLVLGEYMVYIQNCWNRKAESVTTVTGFEDLAISPCHKNFSRYYIGFSYVIYEKEQYFYSSELPGKHYNHGPLMFRVWSMWLE